MNASSKTISKRGQDKRTLPASPGVCLTVLLLFAIMVISARAIITTMEVSAPGTSISYVQDFSILDGLNGTVLNGQSQSVNVFFADNIFLVAAGYTSFTMDLYINQSGAVGTWPTNEYCVTGCLIDAAGNPLSSSKSFSDSATIPAQIWPGWPFYMPDGTQYLPSTEMFEAHFHGTPVYGNPGGFYLNPNVFSGVHFDIKYPTNQMNTVMGGRIVIFNYAEPILSSPNPVPVYSQYFENISEPDLDVTLGNNSGPGGSGNPNALYLQLSGTANFPYILQSATNLTGQVNWLSLMTNSADGNGNWNITITNAPSVPATFFRVEAWPGSVQQSVAK